jgi:DNA-binding HxlR family transcriptional regulator
MLLKDCPVSAALRVIGGKWKPLLLNELKSGTLRYGELRRRIPEASQKVLTHQLRELEASGIVQRILIKSPTLRAEYKLTPYGRTLRPILESLCKWGERHRQSSPILIK